MFFLLFLPSFLPFRMPVEWERERETRRPPIDPSSSPLRHLATSGTTDSSSFLSHPKMDIFFFFSVSREKDTHKVKIWRPCVYITWSSTHRWEITSLAVGANYQQGAGTYHSCALMSRWGWPLSLSLHVLVLLLLLSFYKQVVVAEIETMNIAHLGFIRLVKQ